MTIIIGKGPKDIHVGGVIPKYSKIPAEPPIVLFLNIFIQAKANVQEGNIYGVIAILAKNLLPGKSVLTTSQAKIPPIKTAIADMGKITIKVFKNGL